MIVLVSGPHVSLHWPNIKWNGVLWAERRAGPAVSHLPESCRLTFQGFRKRVQPCCFPPHSTLPDLSHQIICKHQAS